jgi:galactoside O-acetyltransferase
MMSLRNIYKQYRLNQSIKRNGNYILIDKTAVLLPGTSIDFRTKRHDIGITIGTDSMLGCNFILESEEAAITVGERTFINGGTSLIAAYGITIGNDVMIAWGCTIYDHNSHSLNWEHRYDDMVSIRTSYMRYGNITQNKDWSRVKRSPINIGDKVWIGFNSMILKGVTLGEGAVVAAGSVVTKDVAPWTCVGGNPARYIKTAKPPPPPPPNDKEIVVYSCGVGEDISFDIALMSDYRCKIFAFDPTPKSIEWINKQHLPENFVFIPYGISDKTEKQILYLSNTSLDISASIYVHGYTSINECVTVQMKSLEDIVVENNHSYIDILKMDIEGSEFAIIKNSPDHIFFGQIVVEFHERFLKNGKVLLKETIKILKKKGYFCFAVSEHGDEYSFINKHKYHKIVKKAI